MSVVLITGSSSGFGRLTALEFAKNGDRVYATVRTHDAADELENIAESENLSLYTLLLDVTDRKVINIAVKTIIDKENKIDVLVNNAGIAIPGALEDISESCIDLIMQTNFFGPIWLSRAVLPYMRQNQHGRIIMVSSLSALVGLPGEAIYGASKAALETAAEALHHEVDRFGIKVSVIEPGSFNTGMPRKIADNYLSPPGSPYAKLIQFLRKRVKAKLGEGGDPQLIAKLIVKIANGKNPVFRYAAGKQAEQVIKKLKNLTDMDRETFVRQVNNTEWWSNGDNRPSVL